VTDSEVPDKPTSRLLLGRLWGRLCGAQSGTFASIAAVAAVAGRLVGYWDAGPQYAAGKVL
jgi:hypothetical protein